jgi:hypothetical protein
MKKVFFIMAMALVGMTGHVKAQFIVADPAHIATSIVNSINQIVETSTTASNMINNCAPVKAV